MALIRSIYYAAKAPPAQTTRCLEQAQVQMVFTQSGRSYGSRRIQAALQAQGTPLGRYRIRTLMRQQGLKPVWTRRFVHSTLGYLSSIQFERQMAKLPIELSNKT